jgi:histone H3/H4
MGIIVKSKIRVILGGLNLGEDLASELDKRIEEILKRASERAKGNSRRTVYARDL